MTRERFKVLRWSTLLPGCKPDEARSVCFSSGERDRVIPFITVSPFRRWFEKNVRIVRDALGAVSYLFLLLLPSVVVFSIDILMKFWGNKNIGLKNK